MEFSKLRIGYVPCHPSLAAPGDRRRFVYYASRRGIRFEIADPSETYDAVVVTEVADISVWSRYTKGKMIFDFIDSYLSTPADDLKAMFRGAAKFLSRQNRHLMLDYRKGLEAMCRASDAVVCSTAEQACDIRPFCSNVFTILDFHHGVVRMRKSDYSCGETFNLVWEGLPHTLPGLREIKGVLGRLGSRHKIALHIVTDLEYYKYMHRFGPRRTWDDVRDIAEQTFLYAWNEQTCAQIVAACDLAVIPVVLSDPLHKGKPENKLLMFWRIGMPTVASATPAYIRATRSCGVPETICSTMDEWERALESYMSDESLRRNAGQRGLKYVEQNFTEARLLSDWDALFSAVFANESLACVG